ncbi:MAG: glycoside hydrolase family 2, partial [Ruminiclostridium sp.]|nr:glycoside hydrolase family 2 [Ruminiclostridium sp.]
GGHNGGYIPFCFDITRALKTGENIVEVIVTDTLDTDYPYGKQCRKRGGMWYTPISGIWQAVWLESVPENYIKSLKLTPSLDSITIETEGGIAEKTVTIHTENGDIAESFSGNKACIKIPSPVLWSPENPYLYSLTLECGEDRIESYFGLRTIETGKVNNTPCILLNGKPYYFHGLLDQGYYSDGIYTPASPEGYLWDIKEMKKLGFNMLRKHIKIEPDLFYYYCDKYGMIVFQDFVNSGKYNFLIDTALPTIGLKKGITHTATKRRKSIFEDTARKTISLLYNHPCVCYYTIFNEGWGQYDADRIYEELKKIDPTRIYDATSGWFTEKKSDVKSEHIYFRKIKLKADPEKPLVLSEFGGYSCKIENHCFNLDENYGYKTFDSPKSLSAGLSELYLSEIVPAVEQGLCADVLTQVSDVEDETNGLCTYDRQVVKVEERTMKIIAKALNKAFEKKFTV